VERALRPRRGRREDVRRGGGVGKRLTAYLDWLASVEDPSEVGLEALDRLEREAAEENLVPPDRDAVLAQWRADGWPGPLEPLHAALLEFAIHESFLGAGFVHGAAGPRIEWPFGSWLLANARTAIARARRARSKLDALSESYAARARGED
jgi:hypothetical protein